MRSHTKNWSATRAGGRRRHAFTLIELLVVVAIIGLLIAIAVPSFSAARNTAKAASAKAQLKTIATGLTLFQSENGKAYPRTNGFPPSAAGEDPATLGAQTIFGAHWLVRYLVGRDLQGFIPRRIVPAVLQDRDNTTEEQVRWYDPEPNDPQIDRINPYVPIEHLKLVNTEDLASQPPTSPQYPANSEVRTTPLFVDPFGTPILYYAANKFGNALCDSSPNAREYFNHADNEIFTGSDVTFGPAQNFHAISDVCPDNINDIDGFPETWAHYIHDEALHDVATTQNPNQTYKPKPVNRDSYLLFSAGLDLRYGTPDDVRNFNN